MDEFMLSEYMRWRVDHPVEPFSDYAKFVEGFHAGVKFMHDNRYSEIDRLVANAERTSDSATTC